MALKLKTLEQRKIDSLLSAIKSILWADFWPEYKAAHKVGGLEASQEAWNGEFSDEWNKTPYAKAKSYEELVKLLADSGYTPDDIFAQLDEINNKKASYRQKSTMNEPETRSEYDYEEGIGSGEGYHYEPEY